jgi:hypothetical protein
MSDIPQTDNLLAAAKKDWKRNFAGAVIPKKPNFKTPTIRHYFSRNFDQLGRNVYFISIFGRILVKGDGVQEAEKSIYDRISNVTAECEKKVNAMKAIASEAGITDFASYPLADEREITAFVIVPAQKRFIEVMQIADEYLVMVNTLWLEGEIPDREKSKAEMEIKHQLGQIVAMVRKMRIFMQTKVRDARTAAAADDSAEAKKTATEIDRATEETNATEAIRSQGIDDVPGDDEPTDDQEEAVAAAA